MIEYRIIYHRIIKSLISLDSSHLAVFTGHNLICPALLRRTTVDTTVVELKKSAYGKVMENYMWIQHDSTDFCYYCYFPTKSVESVLIPHLLFFCALVAEILTFRCSNSKCGWMKSVDEKSQDLGGKIPSIFCVMLSFTGEFPSFHG